MRSPIAFLVTAFIIAFAVLLLVPLWYILGAVGGEGHAHAVKEIMTYDVFSWNIKEQQRKYGQPDGSVKITDAGEVFIMAQQFSFTPRVIRLETGKKYMLHYYSPDVIHGVSLIVDHPGITASGLHSVVPPGIVAMITIAPHLPGEILMVCTEYCGLAHQVMQAKIIAEGQPFPMTMLPWYQRIGIPKLPVDMWMYHDLIYNQILGSEQALFWDPLPDAPGLFMPPHAGWKYWHYHGPPQEGAKHLEAAKKMIDQAPASFRQDWVLPAGKTKLKPLD